MDRDFPIMYALDNFLVSIFLQTGGVVQWLGRRWFQLSRAGCMTTFWVNCPLWVSQPGQLSLLFLRG